MFAKALVVCLCMPGEGGEWCRFWLKLKGNINKTTDELKDGTEFNSI